SIRNIFEDSTGRIWVATVRHGVFVMAADGSAARAIQEVTAEGRRLQTEGVNTIAEVNPGEVWIGTYSQGIVTINMTTFRTRRILHDAAVPSSLPDDDVWALFRDRSGITWVASGRGLSRYMPQQAAITTIFGVTGRKSGISEDALLGIQPMPSGDVWLGFSRSGVAIFNSLGVRSGYLQPDPLRTETALPQKYVWDFALGAHGEVFTATAQGLYLSDSAGVHITKLYVPGHDPNSHIVSLLLDKDTLWVGGKDGLWHFNPYSLHKSGLVSPTVAPLTDKRVRALVLDHDGSLWIGTENGLNRLDTSSKQIEQILPETANPSALSAGYIATLLIDNRGRLWVGTSGGGINILTGRDAKGRPQFHRIGLEDGLPDINVDKLIADTNGRIWASTDDGTAMIDPTTFAVQSLGRADGQPIANYWV
ncbi:hypothetical protein ABENE_23380, partial [Asticcacaulis benevestitus DSM 16100 = ATCC BAA-896]